MKQKQEVLLPIYRQAVSGGWAGRIKRSTIGTPAVVKTPKTRATPHSVIDAIHLSFVLHAVFFLKKNPLSKSAAATKKKKKDNGEMRIRF